MTLLSKKECSALRGIAITGIFLHNYLHWLSPMIKENEYLFFHKRVEAFSSLSIIRSDILLQLISFFGHYGVPVFLFLSGYGLVLKYEKSASQAMVKTADESAISFIWSHYKKLLLMLIIGFACYILVDNFITPNYVWRWDYNIYIVTMIANLFPNPGQIINPGPYWFFGLIIQLYIIYRLVFYSRTNKWIYGAIIICLLIQLCCIGDTEGRTLNWIRYNSIGSILPFGMGILMARYEKKENTRLRLEKMLTPLWACLVAASSIIVIILGSLNFISWLFVPAFIVTLHVGVIKLFRGKGLGLLNWIGILSSAIFVCHPITRKLIIPISQHGNILGGLVLYIAATIILSIVFKFVFSKINKVLY